MKRGIHCNRLRQIRVEKEVKQAELARLVGVDSSVIRHVESWRRPSYPKLRRLCAEALNLPEGEIFPVEHLQLDFNDTLAAPSSPVTLAELLADDEPTPDEPHPEQHLEGHAGLNDQGTHKESEAG